MYDKDQFIINMDAYQRSYGQSKDYLLKVRDEEDDEIRNLMFKRAVDFYDDMKKQLGFMMDAMR